MERPDLRERFLVRCWVHVGHRESEKRDECHLYTVVEWMGRVVVVERVALGVPWAVQCTGLEGKIYEPFH